MSSARKPYSPSPLSQAVELWNLAYRFSRHLLLTILLCALGAGAGLMYGRRYQPVYHAEAQVRVGEDLDSRAIPGQKEDSSEFVDIPDTLATAFRARFLIDNKLRALLDDLATRPNLAHIAALKPGPAREALITQIRTTVQCDAITRRVFRVTYDGQDPDLVQAITQGLAEIGVRDVVEQRNSTAERARVFLGTEAAEARKRLLDLESDIVGFVKNHPQLLVAMSAADRSKLGLSMPDKMLLARTGKGPSPLKALEADRSPAVQALLMQRSELEAIVAQIEAAYKYDPLQLKTQEIDRLQQSLAELRAQGYTPDYPEFRRINADIERNQREIRELRNSRDPRMAKDLADLNQAKTKIAAIDRELGTARRKQLGVSKAAPDERVLSAEAEYARLNRDLEQTRVHYEKIRDRELDAVINEQLSKLKENPAARIEDPAARPQRPRGVTGKMMTLLSIIVGLGLGLVLGAGRALIDSRLYTVYDVSRAAQVPVLGRIPARDANTRSRQPEVYDLDAVAHLGESASADRPVMLAAAATATLPPEKQPYGLLTDGHSSGDSATPRSEAETTAVAQHLAPSAALYVLQLPMGARAQQCRLIRCRLEDQGDPRVIAVTSSVSGEGKTVLVANLALTYAEGGTAKVVAVDANLASPKLAALLGGSEGEPGPRSSTPTPQKVRDNLYVLPASALRGSDGQAASLRGAGFEKILAELRRSFDYILIDTAAALVSADAKVVLRHADAGLLVTRAARTSSDVVSSAVERLGRHALSGAILNAF